MPHQSRLPPLVNWPLKPPLSRPLRQLLHKSAGLSLANLPAESLAVQPGLCLLRLPLLRLPLRLPPLLLPLLLKPLSGPLLQAVVPLPLPLRLGPLPGSPRLLRLPRLVSPEPL